MEYLLEMTRKMREMADILESMGIELFSEEADGEYTAALGRRVMEMIAEKDLEFMVMFYETDKTPLAFMEFNLFKVPTEFEY